MNICKIQVCTNEVRALGYCVAHYARHRKGLPLETAIKKRKSCNNRCIEINCNNDYYAKGYCSKHYRHYKYPAKFNRKCIVDGCNIIVRSESKYCKGHKKRHLAGKTLDLSVKLKGGAGLGERNGRWSGGNSEYKNHSLFKRQRLARLKQESCKCEHCGKKANYVHHLDGSKDNHELSNLRVVCAKCHRGIYHSGPRGKRKQTKGVNDGGTTI
jgi:hypothetical protein